MADVQRLSLNWIEMDRSIISAISAMQIARGRFDSHSAVTESLEPQSTLVRFSGACSRHGSHQGRVRDEQIAICFDDAERMLDEARARITLARALLSGAPQFEVPATPKFAVAAAFSEGELKQLSLKTLFARCARITFRIVVRAKSMATRSMRHALLLSRRLTSQNNLLFRKTSAFAFGCSNQLRHAMAPKAVRGPRQFYEAAAVVFGAAAFSVIASSALAVWLASDAASEASAAARPLSAVHIAHDVPAASAVYTGCSVSGWGRACYPRRAQP